MATHRRAVFLLAAVLLLPACKSDDNGSVATTTTGPASSTSGGTTITTGPIVLTPEGLGPLTIGLAQAAAEQTGLIQPVGPGCELGPTEAADLKPPLDGTINFSAGKLESIDLSSGASTREGVAPDATVAQINAAYDGQNGFTLKKITETEEQFGFFMLQASKGGKTYSFEVASGETQARSVAVPDPLFCE